ncbi:MAG: epoxyqueuosine reductase QueH [Ruminococcaceae bacterium]|nr:epoxyqueuosine reductase QueH [Oscillospiraceae bacterium]
MKINYGLMLEETLSKVAKAENKASLLLHACCAPCSSYVLEYLSQYFDITLFFHNPNIYPEEEFTVRLDELNRFVRDAGYSSSVISPEYDSAEFFDAVRGMENLPEGGERCRVCYALRLRRTAEAAKSGGFDYFTTTLSISPYKNAEWLNEIGAELEAEYGISYLFSDFKKKNGYKRSIELSGEYGLYRQDYCGCVFSKVESEKRKNAVTVLDENSEAMSDREFKNWLDGHGLSE